MFFLAENYLSQNKINSNLPKQKKHCIICTTRLLHKPEVAGVTFSESDFAPVKKFLNPGPGIFQIWESDPCSDSGYNHRPNRKFPMFLLKTWPHRLLLLHKLKNDSRPGSVVSQILTPGPDPGPKEKRRTCRSRLRIRSHLCHKPPLWNRNLEFQAQAPLYNSFGPGHPKLLGLRLNSPGWVWCLVWHQYSHWIDAEVKFYKFPFPIA